MTSNGSSPTSTPTTARVIVGVDGSEASQQALLWAQFIAASTSSVIEAILVTPVAPPYAWAGAYWGAAPGEVDPDATSEKVLTAIVDKAFGADRPQDLELSVVRGNAAEVLVQRSGSATMVVVGSRGHGGFAGLLLGSVSGAVAEHAACPVLVVHGDMTPPSLPTQP